MEFAPYVPVSVRGRMRYGRGWQVARVVLAVLVLPLLVLFLLDRAWLAALACALVLHGLTWAFRRNLKHDREAREQRARQR